MENLVKTRMKDILQFYQGKRVLVTGHTGFKGTWLCHILKLAGAQVMGYALPPPTEPSAFYLSNIEQYCQTVIGDIRDFDKLYATFRLFQPELVFHLAAQPIVRESYIHPRETYETNVMGTVNVLECSRLIQSVQSILNVTTDKVYYNREWVWAYRENEELDGFDPYSNSKSCSELVTHSYRRSFFDADAAPALSTARAGNVIGGGDFAANRIIPDCVRAAITSKIIEVRNPHSLRPYQHVLEPLFAYLLIAMRQWEEKKYMGYYNVGPDDVDTCTTGDLVELFIKHWGNGLNWKVQSDNGPHEANILRLDCSKMKSVFGWHPHWHVDQAVAKTAEWAKVWLDGGNLSNCMERQIIQYLEA